jgi:hypothetical protein
VLAANMSRDERDDDLESKVSEDGRVTPALRNAFHNNGLKIQKDGLVKWTTESHGHPRTWPIGRKLYDTAVIVVIEGSM